jgi:hypothetical protein
MIKLQYVWDHRAGIAASFMAAATAYSLAIATPLARVIKRPDAAATWWKRAAYDLFIDTPSWLAALGRSGILGGIFNLPGVPSRLPFDNPTRAASQVMRARKVLASEDAKMNMRPPGGGNGGGGGGGGMVKIEQKKVTMRTPGILLPFLIALGLAGMLAAASGCGTAGAQALGRCEMNTIPQVLEGLLVRVVAALFMPGADWTAQLEQAGKDAAPGQVGCLVQAVSGFIEDLTSKRGQADDRFIEARRRGRTFLDAHPASANCEPLPERKLPSLLEEQEGARFGGGGATASFSAPGVH